MNISDWQKQKIEILAQYQEILADIYTLLSEKIPGCNSLFLNIAIKNLKYSYWLRSVPEKILKGQYEYEMLRFKIESVTTGINYLIGQFHNIKKNNISASHAIGILKGIESGDMAKKFHEIVFSTNEFSRELEDLKNKINSEKIDTLRSLQSVVISSYENSLHC